MLPGCRLLRRSRNVAARCPTNSIPYPHRPCRAARHRTTGRRRHKNPRWTLPRHRCCPKTPRDYHRLQHWTISSAASFDGAFSISVFQQPSRLQKLNTPARRSGRQCLRTRRARSDRERLRVPESRRQTTTRRLRCPGAVFLPLSLQEPPGIRPLLPVKISEARHPMWQAGPVQERQTRLYREPVDFLHHRKRASPAWHLNSRRPMPPGQSHRTSVPPETPFGIDCTRRLFRQPRQELRTKLCRLDTGHESASFHISRMPQGSPSLS